MPEAVCAGDSLLRKVSFPWRTTLAVLGGLLLLSRIAAITTKILMREDASPNSPVAIVVNRQLGFDFAVCAVGAIAFAVGLALAMRKNRERG